MPLKPGICTSVIRQEVLLTLSDRRLVAKRPYEPLGRLADRLIIVDD
jgi:hypothetical protein